MMAEEEQKRCTCIFEEDYAIMGSFARCPIHSVTKFSFAKRGKDE